MSSEQPVLITPTFVKERRHEDEISLVDIANLLFRWKKLILGIMTVAVCIGLYYAFTAKRVYQVETIISPPNIEHIQSFNLQNLQNVEVDKIYSSFIHIAQSRRLMHEFFDKFKLNETLSGSSEQDLTAGEVYNNFEKFSGALKLVKDNKDSSIILTLEGTHKDKIGVWLDDYVTLANEIVINRLVNIIQSEIDYKIKKLTLDIKNKRFFYRQEHTDTINRLQEDYQLAKSLGIRDHVFIPNNEFKSNDIGYKIPDQIRKMLLITTNIAGYMKGTKVLQAEINALKNRKLDDIHIVGLRELQEKLANLQAIKIKKDALQAVTVDKKAIFNIEPIRPNRKSIVIISFILGGILGIFSAFVLGFISNLKKTADNEPSIPLT